MSLSETIQSNEPSDGLSDRTDPAPPPGAPNLQGASIGRYLVFGVLGEGAVGAVYAAYDPELDRRVAVKLLHTMWASERARKRLVREARALAKLSSPHVVQVYDAGVHEGNVFIAMELVDGQSFKEWLKQDPRPSVSGIVSAYRDAARGLLAAHERGLVHRDVKPANILLGKDGRVRVADFGLVTDDAADNGGDTQDSGDNLVPVRVPPVPPSASSASSVSSPLDVSPTPLSLRDYPDERLTSTGAMMGTPAYMAPEQYTQAVVGPAADQYSLCISLYEALYGTLPYALTAGDDKLLLVVQLMSKKRSGEILPPPAGSAVPGWIYPVLLRGLSARPENRYPSLAELIAALGEDPLARRRARRRTFGAVLGVSLLGAVAVAGWARSGAFRDPCGNVQEELAGVWDEPVKGKLTEALLTSERPYAAVTAERVVAAFDRYTAAWTRMRGEVCRAERKEERAKSRELLELRERCLVRRRGELRALGEVLSRRPDANGLEKAMSAVESLSPIAYCGEEKALTARVPPPEDPGVRAQVEALTPRLEQIEALVQAGHYQEAIAAAEALSSETHALAHPPTRAQVLYYLGRAQWETGGYDKAQISLREAALLSLAGKDDILTVSAWSLLLRDVGFSLGNVTEAQPLIDWGPALAERANDVLARAEWADALGDVRFGMGRYEEALAQHEQALALREKALGPDHPLAAQSRNNMAIVLGVVGRYEQALAQLEQNVSIQQRVLGPEHPDVALSRSELGTALAAMGRYDEALRQHEQAILLEERAVGPDHATVAVFRNNMANVLAALGRNDEALSQYERVLSMWEKALGPDHYNIVVAESNVASTLFYMGRYAEARPSFERAISIGEKSQGREPSILVNPLGGLGRTLVRLREREAGERHLQRALAIGEKTLGKDHRDLTEPLLGLGELALARRKPADAIPVLERALALDDPDYLMEVELTLAEALWRHGKDRPRALDLAKRARDLAARLGHKPYLKMTNRWLSEHR